MLATTSTIADAVASAIRSTTLTSNARVLNSLANARKTTTPITAPAVMMASPCLKIIRAARAGDRPSAIRILISRERMPTTYAMTPYKPTAPRRSVALDPMADSRSTKLKRLRAFATVSVMNATS